MSFKLPKLNYDYNALVPNIDERTMEIHHSKHHNGYTANLNNAITGTELENSSIENILKTLNLENNVLRNNAGGFYNHSIFWEIISPKGGGAPKSELLGSINNSFGSFEGFKEVFSKAAASRFGSGWAWLCVHQDGRLEVCSTANQDNPIMPGIGCGGNPILG